MGQDPNIRVLIDKMNESLDKVTSQLDELRDRFKQNPELQAQVDKVKSEVTTMHDNLNETADSLAREGGKPADPRGTNAPDPDRPPLLGPMKPKYGEDDSSKDQPGGEDSDRAMKRDIKPPKA